MSLTFQKLTASDIDACLSILKENYPEEKDRCWQIVLRKDIENVLNKAYPSEYLLAILNESIVGFGCWMENGHPTVYCLTWINVTPKEQGKGIGKALVQELETAILKANRNTSYITLLTTKPVFYERLGYKKISKQGENDLLVKKFFPESPF